MRKYLLILIVSALLLLILTPFVNRLPNINRPVAVESDRQSDLICFKSAETSIIAELFDDNSVSGRLDFTPLEKDSLTGPFSGTWRASATATGLNITHTYSAEGVNAAEDRLIIINNDYALIDWDGQGGLEVSSDRIPRVSCDAPVATSESKTYSNETFNMSFNYPARFTLESTIDTTPGTAKEKLDTGSAYVQLFGTEAGTNRSQKIEIMLLDAKKYPVTEDGDIANAETITSNGTTWLVYKGLGTENDSTTYVSAFAVKNNLKIVISGFTATGPESSVYSEELKQNIVEIVKTFKI